MVTVTSIHLTHKHFGHNHYHFTWHFPSSFIICRQRPQIFRLRICMPYQVLRYQIDDLIHPICTPVNHPR